MLALWCQISNSQERQSVKERQSQAITDRFPSTRLFNVQFQQYLPTEFDSELFGEPFMKGRIQNHFRWGVNTNLPVIMKPKWIISTSLRYQYDAFELQNIQHMSNSDMPFLEHTLDFHYLMGSLNFTYFSQIFNKPFIYNVSAIVDGTEKAAERVKGFVGATMLLKKTQRTTIGIGALVFVDPASPVPVAPTFLWEQKLGNSAWLMDFILPQRLLFKRNMFKYGRVSLGSELAGEGFYVYNNAPGFASVYESRLVEIRSGLTYEHSFGKSVIVTFKSGLSTIFNSRLSERGKNTNDYIFATNQHATGYFTLGFSFNPR